MKTKAKKPPAKEIDHARDQAIAQLESIVAMVAALECDYDRLEELREDRANSAFPSKVISGEAKPGLPIDPCGEWWEDNYQSEAEELAELEDAVGNCSDRDDAAQRIREDPLSVQVRSGWYSPGETPEPEEFEILLCTGGPAVRILGELDEHNQPSRAWIEYQDWGTPWTHLVKPSDAVLTYCQQFYFGE